MLYTIIYNIYIFIQLLNQPLQFCHDVFHQSVCQGTFRRKSSFHKSRTSTCQGSRNIYFALVLRTYRDQFQICSLLVLRPGVV